MTPGQLLQHRGTADATQSSVRRFESLHVLGFRLFSYLFPLSLNLSLSLSLCGVFLVMEVSYYALIFSNKKGCLALILNEFSATKNTHVQTLVISFSKTSELQKYGRVKKNRGSRGIPSADASEIQG